MSHFAYFDSDGVIRQTTSGGEAPVIDGLSSIETPYQLDPRAWHVANGELVVGLLDLRDMTRRKLDHWRAIKRARDAAEFGGFTWDGSIFDSDEKSQSRIQGAAQLATLAALASQAFSVDWTLADNSVRTLTGAQMLEVGTAMGVHIMTTHATGRSLRDSIEATTTTEALELITWPA